jgi:hypothetical protein
MCSSVRATRDGLVPLTRAPSYASATWGPYYETLHPPRRVDFIINWKVVPRLMDHAAGLWRRRQNLRSVYEAVHGCDLALWPNAGTRSSMPLRSPPRAASTPRC